MVELSPFVWLQQLIPVGSMDRELLQQGCGLLHNLASEATLKPQVSAGRDMHAGNGAS